MVNIGWWGRHLKQQHELIQYWTRVSGYWLVVDLPLWKMMEFVSWDDDIPNWMESHKSHVPKHQPVIVRWHVDSIRQNIWIASLEILIQNCWKSSLKPLTSKASASKSHVKGGFRCRVRPPCRPVQFAPRPKSCALGRKIGKSLRDSEVFSFNSGTSRSKSWWAQPSS